MKNRKLAIVAFLLVAVLAIGVGYAALADYLRVNGDIEVHAANANVAFDEKIYFSDATGDITITGGKTEGEATLIDSASVTSPDVATFKCNSLSSSASEVTFGYVIKNDSDYDAVVTVAATMQGSATANPNNTNADAFDVSYSFPGFGPGDTVEIVKGGSVQVQVTISLKDGVVAPTEGSITGTYIVELTATAQE